MITTCARPDSTDARRSNTIFRVLVVNTNDSECDAIASALQNSGCQVVKEHDDIAGLNLYRPRNFEAIIVNLVGPRQGALEIIKQLRRYHTRSAILVLTGQHEFQTRVEALELGADDYLAGSFSTEQLLDRMLTVIHRKRVDSTRTITIADLSIDSAKRIAIRGGKQIDLTRREFELLQYLAMHQGEIVSRANIRGHVYKADAAAHSNIVDVYIRYLRKKIESPGKPKLLHTFRGRGYMLGQRESNELETASSIGDDHNRRNELSRYLP